MNIGNRIWIIGPPGSGKTTLARSLSQHLQIKHYELDALFWGPNWKKTSNELFRHNLIKIVRQPSWVIDGQYFHVKDLLVPNLDTLIWLDTKLHISLYRTAKRMVLNRITNKRLWHGNKESLLRFITNFCPYIICSYKEHHRSSLVLQEELQQKSNTICIRTSSSSIKSLIEQTHSAE